MHSKYDIIVVGAGHAGSEAAAAAAKLGSSVLLITMNLANIAQMSCNPAMGGIAKGQIIREIDALGGLSGIVTDKSMIQFRMLNMSKGPAMWSPRSQNDRWLFSQEWRLALERIPKLDFWEDMVVRLQIEKGKICGVVTKRGHHIRSNAVILTNGTFLNGIIHIGEKQYNAGRIGESASYGITEQLNKFGFEAGRMKTGTPVRVDGRTINYNRLIEQKGDKNPKKFSFTNTPKLKKQKSCYLAYTSIKVHDVLRKGFEKSPMFTGRIQGVGPRYCPSIEDKIDRFSDKDRHQLFIEPEGWNTVEVYVNGFSSSLPEEIQFNALKQIEGFENVKIFRPGYAIEYDYFLPIQLKSSLETKKIDNLYFAGQINGTTGYEEAAAQGLMAGINASRKLQSKSLFVLKRSEAYIGVLIDDLITKGVDEPYRMFTSRAEYRLLLRQDNADIRLTEKGFNIGLASSERMDHINIKKRNLNKLIDFLKKENLDPTAINEHLIQLGTMAIKQKRKLAELLLRPQISIHELIIRSQNLQNFIETEIYFDNEVIEQAEIIIKYASYIQKEEEIANQMLNYEDLKIPDNYNFQFLQSLSLEAREKLKKIQPQTIGQASRISGISPSDISVLIISLKK